MISRHTIALALALTCWLSASVAAALEVLEVERESTEIGSVSSFRATTDLDPTTLEFRWSFGDETQTEFVLGQDQVEHTYAQPGHYAVNVLIREPANPLLFGNKAFTQTVFRPLTPNRPQSSTTVVFDEASQRVFNVNPDNDSVSVVDAVDLTKLAEIPVYAGPEALAFAPDGKLWVVNRDDYAIAIIDPATLAVETGFRLPYASQPSSLVIAQQGNVAYVALMALGKVVKIDVASRQIIAELDAGAWARGLALNHDETRLYVTRWITTGESGIVLEVDTTTMVITKQIPLEMDPGPDSDRAGRGIPNYLFNATISPDGTEVWVPGKKDNIQRGPARDGLTLNQDNIVRPLVSVIDIASGAELMDKRLDLNDRNLPSDVVFSPLGDYAFVIVTGSGFIDVRDMYDPERVSKADLKSNAIAPRGAAITSDGKLFLHSFLTRSMIVYDVSDILASVDFPTKKIGEVALVESDKLDAQQLLGKQVFYNSEDKRMTIEGYISCASCHFDGFEDGRVWDFTERGEGLRNTTSLLGRRGMGHGNVHWSANFDEIQDFEHEIRALFSGEGFVEIEGEGADAGTENLNPPLDEPMAGLSPELDALAAYVESLDQVNRSPFRDATGSLTDDARAGRAIFGRLGCDFCHAGADFTDSARGLLHDVGTLTEASGGRLGQELTGIDTPTLLGVWETAPYLHDGSAATLKDAMTTSNPSDAHGFVSSLNETELDQLVAYMLQIDHAQPPKQLPFEGSPPEFVPDDAFDETPQIPVEQDPPASGAQGPTVAEGPGQSDPAGPASSGIKSSGCAHFPGSPLPAGIWWAAVSVLALLRGRRAN